ncbi:hypothetical protein Ddc_19909 [Ditylenchus destructor]|nr:hypothetical protein Ddc_19909 [Ditylenchus destructor]
MTDPTDMKAMLQMLLDERKEAKEREIKAQEREERLLKEAREREERLLKEAREREERFAAMLAGRSGTAVPAQNAEQLLISNLSLRIELFNYLPDEDFDFQTWYKRHGDIFEEDGKDVTDAAKARKSRFLPVPVIQGVSHHSSGRRPRVGTDKATIRAAEGRELALTKPPFERPKAASWH